MTEPELTNDTIAEQVMGWTFNRDRGEWFCDGAFVRQGFAPLDDAKDDLEVFSHVRAQIDKCNPRFLAFYSRLIDVLQQDSAVGPVGPDYDYLCLMHYYRVGDYSRAAMAAIQPSGIPG